jgi:hypothetical protein
MAEFLNFEPKEFQVLEEIDFDETIQRPEKIRFFTLDEQITDAFEKLIPSGKVSKFQLEVLAKRVDKIRNLYESYIIPTDKTYELRQPEFSKKLDWLIPAYNSMEYSPEYNFGNWASLFNEKTANFYTRMLASLPRPYMTNQNGMQYVMDTPTTFVSKSGNNPIRGLPPYELVRTRRHDDGRISILKVPVDGTGDDIKINGYFMMKRPVDIPNPMDGHDFLEKNEAKFIPATDRSEIIPGIDAIMTHGVPVTADPYGEGMKYLKVYDVSLADVPWVSWRSRFPPVEAIMAMPAIEEIVFPKVTEIAPDKKLIEEYRSAYFTGISPRKWLMEQVDGGELVIKMLLSMVGKNGSVNQIPGIDLAEPQYPASTPAECALTGIDFNEFVVRGLLRKDKCVPVEFIRQERKTLGYKNRENWKETTGEEILRSYMKALEPFRIKAYKEKRVAEPKTAIQEDSEERKEILAVLEDTHRFGEDRLRDIRELVRHLPVVGRTYRDPIKNGFVVCQHTLAVLAGDLDKDRLKFNAEWTALMNGFRVCKFCGERVVAQDFLDQDVYDENGFKVTHADAFEQTGFDTAILGAFVTGLRALTSLFDRTSAGDDMVFLILSLIQVLPEAGQTSSILTVVRSVVDRIGKDRKDRNKQAGFVGLAGACILLQSHLPILTPRRSFGPKPLLLSGYPRDEEKPAEFTIVDTLLTVIRKSFEAAPTSFKGPSADTIRSIIGEKAGAKKQILAFLGLMVKAESVSRALKDAKAVRDTLPPAPEEPRSMIPTIQPPKEMGVFTKYTPCASGRPFWKTGHLPRYVQRTVESKMRVPLSGAPDIVPSPSARAIVTQTDKAVIRANLALKKGEKKIEVGDDWRINLRIAIRLSNLFLFPIPELNTVDPTQGDSLLRDIVRGYLNQIMAHINESPERQREFTEALTKDIVLYTLMADLENERKKTNSMRAMERKLFTDRMRLKTDVDREITKDLLDKGLAGYIITSKDLYAIAAEALEKEMERVAEPDEEVGVGVPRDLNEQGAVGMPENADNGDYGDFQAFPDNEGRDYAYEGGEMDDGNQPI